MTTLRETEVAIALSARDWSDRLHRFLADHGGARVRLTAMGPEDLVAEPFDVLLIDDICSFLTPRLIERLQVSGRQVVGVYDPAEFASGKDRLLECGVADVIEAEAHPDEFVAVLSRVAAEILVNEQGRDTGPEVDVDSHTEARAPVIVVSGPPGGTGTTEVALALSLCLRRRELDVVLIDGDDHAPSLAQRLGLPLHPNLRTAIDIAEHRTGSVSSALHSIAGGLRVMPGLPNVDDWAEVRPLHVADVVEQLRPACDVMVIDVGCQLDSKTDGGRLSRHRITHQLIAGADQVVGVGLADPVGIARLIDWLSSVGGIVARSVDVLLNRTPRDSFRRNELIAELTRSYQPSSLGLLPEDRKVAAHRWDGTPVQGGRFYRGVDRWAHSFVVPGLSS